MKRLLLAFAAGIMLSLPLVAAPVGAGAGKLYESVLFDGPRAPLLNHGSVEMNSDYVVKVKIQTDAPNEEFFVRMEHGGAYLIYPTLGPRRIDQLGMIATDKNGKGDAEFDLKSILTDPHLVVTGPNFVVSEWLNGPPTFATAYAVHPFGPPPPPPVFTPPPPPPPSPLPAGPDQGNLADSGITVSTPSQTFGYLYQSFVPTRTELTAVDLFLRVGAWPNGGPSRINIRRFTPDGEIVGTAETIVPGPEFTDRWVRYEFDPPLQLTPQNWYVIEFEDPAAESLQWWASTKNPYARGNYFSYSGTPVPAWDTVFVTY